MDWNTRWLAPGLTLLSLGVLGYLLLGEDGWHDGRSWVTMISSVLFVAVAWLYARALARRESYEAASVLVWWTFVAVSLFWAFAP